MAIVTTSKKACSVNPLKMSQPIGGSARYEPVTAGNYVLAKAAKAQAEPSHRAK